MILIVSGCLVANRDIVLSFVGINGINKYTLITISKLIIVQLGLYIVLFYLPIILFGIQYLIFVRNLYPDINVSRYKYIYRDMNIYLNDHVEGKTYLQKL